MAKKKSNKKLYEWNFSELYATNAHYEKAIKKVSGFFKKLVSYKGQIRKASQEVFLTFIDLKTKVDKELGKLIVYAHWFYSDMQNAQWMKNFGLMRQLIETSSPMLSWINSELRTLGKTKVIKYISNSKKHKHLKDKYEEFFRIDKYHLKSYEEELLAHYVRPLSSFDQVYTSLVQGDYKLPVVEIMVNKKLKKVKLTQAFMLKQLTQSSPRQDQQTRLAIYQERYKIYHDNATTIAEIYASRLSAQETTNRLEGFDSALHAGLWNDNVPIHVFTDFIKYAYKNKKLYYDYVKLHRTHLKSKGIKKYHVVDRKLYLEIPTKSEIEMSVEKAITIIKKATAFLGDEYADALNEVLKPGHIDYFEREGKSQGGFMISQPGTPAYILMNWTNSIDSLFILAHEVGHAVHSYFAFKAQKYEYAGYPILLAEIASTFIEFLAIFYLLKKAGGSRERKVFLTQTILTRLITIYFGIAEEAKFEWQARELAFQNKQIDKEILAKIFTDNHMITDLFDKTNKNFPVVNSPYLWSIISHHFGTTFYLHKYALTAVVTFNLLKAYFETGQAKGFMELLKLGGRHLPLKAIKDTTGVDLLDIKSHDCLLEIFKENLTSLAKQLGISY